MVGNTLSAGVNFHEPKAANGRGYRIPCDPVEDTTVQGFLPQPPPSCQDQCGEKVAIRPQFLTTHTPIQVRQNSIQETSEPGTPIGGHDTQLTHQASVEASIPVYTPASTSSKNSSIPTQVCLLYYLLECCFIV